ncbi:EexN family lipoprotein [Salmonella enterica]|nr:hypothetical protein [Salmonella enterica]EFQ3653562.1 EexN family lipoprotein [Salmonella enterica]EGK5691800.1 EexN family lipoprotein [Salmonella enterica]
MKRIFPVIISTTFILTITGCKEERSESWYKQHPDETYTTYSKCLEDGEANNNCEFAMRAALMFSHSGSPEVKDKFIKLFEQKEKALREK